MHELWVPRELDICTGFFEGFNHLYRSPYRDNVIFIAMMDPVDFFSGTCNTYIEIRLILTTGECA